MSQSANFKFPLEMKRFETKGGFLFLEFKNKPIHRNMHFLLQTKFENTV